MRVTSFVLVTVVFIVMALSSLMAQVDEGLIVNEGKPEKAKELFFRAMKEWLSGKKENALELYEKGVIADRSILAENDMGMAHALIESFREKVVHSASPSLLLYRLGYFENVISGNLLEARNNFEKALFSTENPRIKAQARIELEKISRELDFLRQSGIENEKNTGTIREKDLENYLKKDREDDRERQIADLEEEIDGLLSKITDLQGQEKQAAEEMETRRDRVNRYSRNTYFTDYPEGGEASSTVPSGQHSQNLELFYANRRKFLEQEETIRNIRRQIETVQKNITSIKVKITRIRETPK